MGKYDPPDKATLLKPDSYIEYVGQLMVESAATNYPKMVKKGRPASRARQIENVNSLPRTQARAVNHANLRRGRKPVVTAAKVDLICSRLAEGESETAGCRLAGVGLTAWHDAKKKSQEIRGRIASARDQWARLRYERHMAALYQSQAMRAASRKLHRPRPIHQANLVVWHLITRVSLDLIAIPDEEIAVACERFNVPLQTWRQQASSFRLMQKIYAERAKKRFERPTIALLTSCPVEAESDPFADAFGYSAGPY